MPAVISPLPRIQKKELQKMGPMAKDLAGMIDETPIMLQAVMEIIAPGYGETLKIALKRPDILKQVHQQLVQEKSWAPTNVLNGGFGGV